MTYLLSTFGATLQGLSSVSVVWVLEAMTRFWPTGEGPVARMRDWLGPSGGGAPGASTRGPAAPVWTMVGGGAAPEPAVISTTKPASSPVAPLTGKLPSASLSVVAEALSAKPPRAASTISTVRPARPLGLSSDVRKLAWASVSVVAV